MRFIGKVFGFLKCGVRNITVLRKVKESICWECDSRLIMRTEFVMRNVLVKLDAKPSGPESEYNA